MKVKEIMALFEEFAPLNTQEEWDNSGIQILFDDKPITKMLLATDLTISVAQEAVQKKCQLIVVHHPPFFRPVKAFHFTNPLYQPILAAIQNKISVIALHTNFDNCPEGLNEFVLKKLGVVKTEPFLMQEGHYLKLVVYCPETHSEKVREAICQAGAGHIGKYSDCAFRSQGIGSFKGNAQTNPHIGKAEQLEFTPEVRLETIVPEHKKNQIVQAMLKTHPYEEVAYDLIPLKNTKPGLGRIGYLKQGITDKAFAKLVKTKLHLKSLNYTPRSGKIQKIALITGGAGSFYTDAVRANCDAYISGDIKHNQWVEAGMLNLLLVDASHYGTERFFGSSLETLLNQLPQMKKMKILLSQIENFPFETI